MKLTLTQVGLPKTIQTKYGPKEKSFVKAKEYGDKYLNYWLSPATSGWAAGSEIEVEKVEESEYNGKPQYNIILAKKTPNSTPVETMVLSKKLDQIQMQLRAIIDHLRGTNKLGETSDGTPVPFPHEDDYKDVPF